LARINALADRVQAVPDVKSNGSYSSANGCSGGCAFRTDYFCSALSPADTLARFSSALEGAGGRMFASTDVGKTYQFDDGTIARIDSEPSGLRSTEPGAGTETSCGAPTPNSLAVYFQ